MVNGAGELVLNIYSGSDKSNLSSYLNQKI